MSNALGFDNMKMIIFGQGLVSASIQRVTKSI